MSTIASMRCKVSSGLLLWQVVREPSWPVLRAMTMSRASAPRTSPTTSRSGRRRSAARTNDRTVTSPTPSTDGGRASSRTTCGVARRSSAASSMVTTRSPGGTCPSSALRNVVFPEEVAPLTTRLARWRTSATRSATTGSGAKAERGTPPAAKRRMARQGPSTATGGITAWTREPSANRASTIGLLRSTRRPSGATIRSIRSAATPSARSSPRSSRPRRSTHTSRPALTRISVTVGSSSNGSSGPRPWAWASAAPTTRRRSSAGRSGASARTWRSAAAARSSPGSSSRRRWMSPTRVGLGGAVMPRPAAGGTGHGAAGWPGGRRRRRGRWRARRRPRPAPGRR